jgi:hypothetical protein
MKPVNSDGNLNQDQGLQQEKDRFARGFAQDGRKPFPEGPASATDPDLARVHVAWPALPTAIRRAILAMIES